MSESGGTIATPQAGSATGPSPPGERLQLLLSAGRGRASAAAGRRPRERQRWQEADTRRRPRREASGSATGSVNQTVLPLGGHDPPALGGRSTISSPRPEGGPAPATAGEGRPRRCRAPPRGSRLPTETLISNGVRACCTQLVASSEAHQLGQLGGFRRLLAEQLADESPRGGDRRRLAGELALGGHASTSRSTVVSPVTSTTRRTAGVGSRRRTVGTLRAPPSSTAMPALSMKLSSLQVEHELLRLSLADLSTADSEGLGRWRRRARRRRSHRHLRRLAAGLDAQFGRLAQVRHWIPTIAVSSLCSSPGRSRSSSRPVDRARGRVEARPGAAARGPRRAARPAAPPARRCTRPGSRGGTSDDLRLAVLPVARHPDRDVGFELEQLRLALARSAAAAGVRHWPA